MDNTINRVLKKRIIEKNLTNLDLMKEGKAPIMDGRHINLHHILGEEAGPMLEILATTHKKHHGPLHRLIENGHSFRHIKLEGGGTLDGQYNAFKTQWWKARAKDFE